MTKNVILTFGLLLIFSCKSDDYLNKFILLDKFPESNSQYNDFTAKMDKRKKGIPKAELNLFFKDCTNCNPPTFIGNEYYYGIKTKFTDDIFLVTYEHSYKSNSQYNNILLKPKDLYVCTYDVNKSLILSKLIIQQGEPTLRYFSFKKNIFEITTRYFDYQKEFDEKKKTTKYLKEKFMITKKGMFYLINSKDSIDKSANIKIY